MDTQPDTTAVEVAIIGAGFGGLGMAIRLDQAGIRDWVILEQAGAIGGTWRDNTYPGCACDVASHMYSFSFAPNPAWSRVYAPAHEIRAYLQRTVEQYDLHGRIRLNTAVTALCWDAATARWQVHTADGRIISAHHVVSAHGPLSRPADPDIAGLEDFAGTLMHSARWDHGVDLAGKRVAVIGTGASAIQFIPAIAPAVAKLSVFQRTAPWVVPRFDRAYGGAARRLFRKAPALARLYRWWTYWRYEVNGFGVIGYDFASRLFERLGNWHRKRQVCDPALRERLRPHFRIGCKRILVADDYYPVFNRDNVELVTEPIARVTPDAVVDTAGRKHPADVIVLGTGFRVTEALAPFPVHGRDGRELSAGFSADARHYLGVHVHGFPNFHLLLGPNTALGHNSVVFMIEAQVDYILQAIRSAGRRETVALDVKPQVQAQYTQHIQRRLAGTSWLSGCRSWYLDAQGRNTTLWPGFSFSYWYRTRQFHPREYEVLRPHADTVAQTPSLPAPA